MIIFSPQNTEDNEQFYPTRSAKMLSWSVNGFFSKLAGVKSDTEMRAEIESIKKAEMERSVKSEKFLEKARVLNEEYKVHSAESKNDLDRYNKENTEYKAKLASLKPKR